MEIISKLDIAMWDVSTAIKKYDEIGPIGNRPVKRARTVRTPEAIKRMRVRVRWNPSKSVQLRALTLDKTEWPLTFPDLNPMDISV